jgi:Bacterial antitoxin of type II TA system, VapB
MSRTCIDIDDAMPAEAVKIFGTKTKIATVNAALESAIKCRKRVDLSAWLDTRDLPNLTDPQVSGKRYHSHCGADTHPGTADTKYRYRSLST